MPSFASAILAVLVAWAVSGAIHYHWSGSTLQAAAAHGLVAGIGALIGVLFLAWRRSRAGR
jgi:hypothetical protein